MTVIYNLHIFLYLSSITKNLCLQIHENSISEVLNLLYSNS